MSAFMVSHDCITRVVLSMRAFHAGYAEQDRDLLGMQLIELNRRAIKARYGELPEVEPYRYVEPLLTNRVSLQAYKSLRCFIYQCSEGDVPDETLYAHVAEARDNMAEAVGHRDGKRWDSVATKAAYDEAEWG
jgi:hypothetical protein